jgi:hypothetical protein
MTSLRVFICCMYWAAGILSLRRDWSWRQTWQTLEWLRVPYNRCTAAHTAVADV